MQFPPPPPPPPGPGSLPPPPPPGNLPPPASPVYPGAPAWQNPAFMAPPPNYAAALNVQYAGFWIRLVAYIVDSVILLVANWIIGFVLGIFIGLLIGVSGSSITDSSITTLNWISLIVGLALGAGYFSFYWAGGQTLAMRWLRLRVVDANTGEAIGVSRGFVRWLGLLVSALPCYLGLVWAAFDPRKQGWHDKLANSVVVSV